ncbi:hypothetical protein FRC12_007200 [Ceratobasidium sp. 428]|nr:hypothetical protein FRC12_007200 [Ceratobasidium sp. 428]
MLYKLAIPYVWEEVDNARQLLLLLDAAFENPIDDPEPREVSLLDTVRSSNAFARFDVYAPYVKSLDVYGNKRKRFKITGWKVLIARSRNHVLLPNLHTLVTQTSCDSHGPDQIMWVAAFNSPSLVNLLIAPSELGGGPAISYEAASVVMRTISPQISKLRK